MDFQQPEEFRMLQELVARFIKEHLLPLEPGVLARETGTGLLTLPAEDRTRLDAAAREIGLAGLPAPLLNSDAQARIMMRNQIVFQPRDRKSVV